MEIVNVLIISDVRIYREGIAFVLDNHPGLRVSDALAEVDDHVQLIQRFEHEAPEVILIDMAMPSTLPFVLAVGARFPQIKFVALGITNDADAILRCIECGVQGYVGRQDSIDDLCSTIESVLRDEVACPPKLVSAVFDQLRRQPPQHAGQARASIRQLTPREIEVARLVEAGLSNKQIARHLNIQTATVKNHVHNLLEKLGVHHRSEAAALLRGQETTNLNRPISV